MQDISEIIAIIPEGFSFLIDNATNSFKISKDEYAVSIKLPDQMDDEFCDVVRAGIHAIKAAIDRKQVEELFKDDDTIPDHVKALIGDERGYIEAKRFYSMNAEEKQAEVQRLMQEVGLAE